MILRIPPAVTVDLAGLIRSRVAGAPPHGDIGGVAAPALVSLPGSPPGVLADAYVVLTAAVTDPDDVLEVAM
jgi:hypothetical protein